MTCGFDNYVIMVNIMFKSINDKIKVINIANVNLAIRVGATFSKLCWRYNNWVD